MTAFSRCRQSLRRVALALLFGRGIRRLSSDNSRTCWETGSVRIWHAARQCHARFRLLRPCALWIPIWRLLSTRHLIGVEVRGTIQRRFNTQHQEWILCRTSSSAALWAFLSLPIRSWGRRECVAVPKSPVTGAQPATSRRPWRPMDHRRWARLSPDSSSWYSPGRTLLLED